MAVRGIVGREHGEKFYQAQRDPSAYRPDVAETLNNLAILYRDTGRLADAQTAFTEALAIYRDLARDNPNVYANLATSVNSRLSELHEPHPSKPRR